MGFWIFMTVTVMLLPITMIVFGRVFIYKPPKEINSFYGYRTKMSMKNKESWIFAHQYIGKLWWILGWLVLVLSLLPMFFVLGQDADRVGKVAVIITIFQLLPLCGSIIPVERALKRNFDEQGLPR